MNILNCMRVFLSGAIDRVEDDGVEWRNYIKNKSEEKKFGLSFFDPCDKPKGLGSEIGVEKEKVKKLLHEGKWLEAKNFTKGFRRLDLRGVDWADFIIVKIDLAVHMCGTYDEIFTAWREGKPVFIIMGKNQKKENIPSWLVSYIDSSEEIFETEDECLNYLEKIDNGSIKLDNRWVKINL